MDKNQNEELSPAERKELNKCLRIEELANDFDRSHHYMTDKQSYSQQDVDYAFSLGKKERKTEGENDQLLENEMYQAPDSTASTTYKLLIMQKIFGGMRERCKQKFGTMIYGENINSWLFNDITRSIDRKKDQMKMIVRAVKRSMDEPKKADITNAVIDLIDSWIHRTFGDMMDDDNYVTIKAGLGNTNFPVLIKIINMTKDVMKENDQAPIKA